MNFVTDFMPTISMIFEAPEPMLMKRGPRAKDSNIIEPLMVFLCVCNNLLLTCVFLSTYIIGIYWRTGEWDGNVGNDEGCLFSLFLLLFFKFKTTKM